MTTGKNRFSEFSHEEQIVLVEILSHHSTVLPPKKRLHLTQRQKEIINTLFDEALRGNEEPLPPGPAMDFTPEEKRLIETLRANGQLLVTSNENAPLPHSMTHMLLRKPGENPKLIRKRFAKQD